jgi:hypothetical protein
LNIGIDETCELREIKTYTEKIYKNIKPKVKYITQIPKNYSLIQ